MTINPKQFYLIVDNHGNIIAFRDFSWKPGDVSPYKVLHWTGITFVDYFAVKMDYDFWGKNMYVIKMKLQDDNKKAIEWYLQGFDKRPLRFASYGLAEREAYYQQQKHKSVNGFSCCVLEETNE